MALAGVGGALTACSVGELDLSSRACPCVEGYTCDAVRNVCVAGPVGQSGGPPGDATVADGSNANDSNPADSSVDATLADGGTSADDGVDTKGGGDSPTPTDSGDAATTGFACGTVFCDPVTEYCDDLTGVHLDGAASGPFCASSAPCPIPACSCLQQHNFCPNGSCYETDAGTFVTCPGL
jgi:hypothetical protein